MRPRLADLFCKAGGAGMGFHRAGFDVVGVDLEPQPNYPFEFVQADALTFDLAGFDAAHTSPPCQAYSDLSTMTTTEHPRLIEPTRELLEASGLPYSIENVVGAPLRNPIRLCGSYFGLGAGGRYLQRHRLFESNVAMMSTPCSHRGQPIGVYGTGGGGQMTRGYKARGVTEAREALGTPWMTLAECAQAIPPAYTEYVGRFLMAEVRARART